MVFLILTHRYDMAWASKAHYSTGTYYTTACIYVYLRFDEGEEDLDPRDHEERSEDRAVSFLAVELAVVFQEVGLALHLDKVNQSGNNK